MTDPFLEPGPFDPAPAPTDARGRLERLRDDPEWRARRGADELDGTIAGHVLDVGWFVLGVPDHAEPGPDGEPAHCPMAYTVGLPHTFDHPELILFGFPPDMAHGVFEDFVERLRSGERFESGERRLPNGPRELRWRCLPVAQNQLPPHVGYALAFHRLAGLEGEPRAVQLVWPDAENRLPGDPGCEPSCARQPHLDVPLTDEEVAAFQEEWDPK